MKIKLMKDISREFGSEIMSTDKKDRKILISIALFFAVGLYSFSAVFGKFSAFYEILSWQWILLYGVSIGVLVIYSMIWQLILEKISLSQAYMSKGFYYGFILLWSAFIFNEAIKWNQILGVIVITIGIVVGKKDDHR